MGLLDDILKLAAENVLVVEHVDDEEAARRMEICVGCDRFDAGSVRCKVCKCYLDVKTRTKINNNPKKFRQEITHCPKGKWGDLETANEYRKIDGLPPLSL